MVKANNSLFQILVIFSTVALSAVLKHLFTQKIGFETTAHPISQKLSKYLEANNCYEGNNSMPCYLTREH